MFLLVTGVSSEPSQPCRRTDPDVSPQLDIVCKRGICAGQSLARRRAHRRSSGGPW